MTAVGLRNRRGGGVNSHTITETAYEFTGGRRGRYGRRGVAGGASSGETNACCGFLVGLVFFFSDQLLHPRALACARRRRTPLRRLFDVLVTAHANTWWWRPR